jgi:hypothetical protein
MCCFASDDRASPHRQASTGAALGGPLECAPPTRAALDRHSSLVHALRASTTQQVVAVGSRTQASAERFAAAAAGTPLPTQRTRTDTTIPDARIEVKRLG